MNDELKKQLQKLLSNPGMTNLEDLEVEKPSIEEAESFKVESPEVEEEFELDSELPKAAEALTAKSEANLAALPKKEDKFEQDTEVTKQLRKLMGHELPDSDEIEVEPAVIDDPQAPQELRKAALQKVREKYLGR